MAKLICFDNITECFINRRINRFMVDIVVNNERSKAYLCNTGKLLQLLKKGKKAYCLESKKNMRLLAIEDYGEGALVDTYYQMKSFEKAVRLNVIPWLRNCVISKRNPRLGKSVLDYLLICDSYSVYTELKSAVLRLNDNIASYPDTVSLRGRRHLKELIKYAALGGKALIVFVAALPHVSYFKPNDKIDPQILSLIKQALKKGVIVKAFSEYFEPQSKCIVLDNYDLQLII